MKLPTSSAVVTQVLTRMPSYWQTFKSNSNSAFRERFTALNNWYTKFLRLDEVQKYQDRVFTLQERLLQAQEQRREIGKSLAEIRKRSNLLQDEIHKVKRQEDIEKFLSLMKEETEVLRQEHEVSRTFQECDQTERELFTAFTNAVRDSHEKQRAQLEYTKYFGIILSIAGSFLAFCYTTLRKDDLKRFIEQSLARNGEQNPANNNSNISNSSSSSDNSDLIDFVKTETSRLGDMIREVARVRETEQETRRQFFYYVGFGALVLVIFKVISTN